MGLTITKSPEKTLRIVSEAIKSIESSAVQAGPLKKFGRSGTLTAPIPVHAASLKNLSARQDLNKAPRIGWLCLALCRGEPVAVAEVTAVKSRLGFSHLNEGPLAEQIAAAILKAEKLADVAADDYQVGLLRLPALVVSVLWLRGKKNLLIVLPPAHHGLRAGEIYEEKEFLDLMRRAASNIERSEDDIP